MTPKVDLFILRSRWYDFKTFEMRDAAGFQFTDGDSDIVHYVHELRVATLDHLAALTGRSYKTLERRVPKLREERYLRRLRPRPHKGLYVIGPEAPQVLIEAGHAAEEFTGKRFRENEWRDLAIPHALHVADIKAKLMFLSRSSPVKLAFWQHEGPDLYDSVATREGKLPVRPDAYFVLDHARSTSGKNASHFFLEADVGTMAHTRIAEKITAYAAYHQQQRHVAKFGIDYFQVAIVTVTTARADNLKAEFLPAMTAGQRRAYHFVPIGELTIEALFAGSV